MTARILYIDIEGGWGGSSRSLLYLLRALDRKRFQPVVWHRREGPVAAELDRLNIERLCEPAILSIVPRRKKNWKNWLAQSPRMPSAWRSAGRVRAFGPDILHLNYEGLVPWHWAAVRQGLRVPTVMTFRTMSPANQIYRLYARHINRWTNHLIFITENEVSAAVAAGVDVERIGYSVLYNTVNAETLARPMREDLASSTLRLLFLGTLLYEKGPDRLLELAEKLKQRAINAEINVYGGSPRYRKLLLFKHRVLETLRTEARMRGLQSHITFHGHTADPMAKLCKADLLLRPSRDNDPWGRDVIEALATGVPVLANGSYSKFVRDGWNGRLFPDWDADAYADAIADLDRDRKKLLRFSQNASDHASKLFDPSRYAKNVGSIYTALLAGV